MKTRFFFDRDKAIAYAQSIENSHEVDVRQTDKRRFAVFVDGDVLWATGFCIYRSEVL